MDPSRRRTGELAVRVWLEKADTEHPLRLRRISRADVTKAEQHDLVTTSLSKAVELARTWLRRFDVTVLNTLGFQHSRGTAGPS